MIRLGMVDFDTSHVVEFTRRLHHVDVEPAHWVDGARVVAGVPGTSLVAPETIGPNTEILRSYGVAILDDPAELFGKVDAVLVTSVDGGVHLERARPFLERGVPTFVDKPFACSLADAREIVRTAEARRAPLMSCSSLRYAPEVVAECARGGIVGASTFGPAPTRPRNPGLFHYGIHAVEMLYTLMGPGCERLSCHATPEYESTTGVWAGGRLGTMRGSRSNRSYGYTVFHAEDAATSAVSTEFIYRELLRQVVRFFETGAPPIDVRETLEIVAFIEAAKASAEAGGAPVDVPRP